MCYEVEMLGSSGRKVGLTGRKLKTICMVALLRSRSNSGAKQVTLLTQVRCMCVCVLISLNTQL